MVDQILPSAETTGSSAAANSPAYSAQQLADIYMRCRGDFVGMDMEDATQGWNDNFLFDFLFYIGDPEQIDLAIEWINIAWVEKHHMFDTYDDVKDCQLTMQGFEFTNRLKDIRNMAIKKIEAKKKKDALLEKMLKGNTVTTAVSQPPTEEKAIETKPPQFVQQTLSYSEQDLASYRVLLSDLPKELSEIVVVSQEVFDVFVWQLNTDTWTIVEQNKKCYSDLLRFLSNFHYITKRDTTRDLFDKLLHRVLKGKEHAPSFVSSMNRRQETSKQNITRSYKCYASPLNEDRQERRELIRDSRPLEKSLQPVLEKMKEESQKGR